MILKNILIVSVLVGSLFSANWHYLKNEDKITGKESFFVLGESVASLRKMDFPYTDTKSKIGFRCSDKSQSISFIFNVIPNLSRSKIKDGYSQVTVAIKVDDIPYLVYLKQQYGSKLLVVAKRKYKSDGYEVIKDVDSFINTIGNSKKVLMQIGWHGNGGVYFEYDTNGLKNKLKEMQNECGFTKKEILRQKQLKMIANMSKKEKDIYESKIFCNKEYGGWKLNESGNIECK